MVLLVHSLPPTRMCFRYSHLLQGSVLIFCIARRYDFFLVSQNVREGTIAPTSYNVIADTSGLTPDRVSNRNFSRICSSSSLPFSMITPFYYAYTKWLFRSKCFYCFCKRSKSRLRCIISWIIHIGFLIRILGRDDGPVSCGMYDNDNEKIYIDKKLKFS